MKKWIRLSVAFLLVAAALTATGILIVSRGPDRGGRSDRSPHVILITLESVRYDHVSCLSGNGRATTPNIDRLAEESMIYENAHAVTSWTLPTHASLFTGLYPTAHQTTAPKSRLDDSYVTLAEILAAREYQCASIVSGPYLLREYNLDQGFEYYDDEASSVDHWKAHGDVTNPKMEALLRRFLGDRLDRKRPLFLFAYFWDPHYDYIPPAPYDTMFVTPECEPVNLRRYESNVGINPSTSQEQLEYVVSQYDGEIRCTDECLGRFFAMLKKKGLWEDALIIVTSDHGEEFFEHGTKGHKNNLYVESLHVPLIIKYPRAQWRGRDAKLISHVDILPTILDVTGSVAPALVQGHSLVSSTAKQGRSIFHELLCLWYSMPPGSDEPLVTKRQWYAVQQEGHKLVSVPEENRLELYELTSDPRERQNVVGSNERRQPLAQLLEGYLDANVLLATGFKAGGSVELDVESLRRLRSLGYVH